MLLVDKSCYEDCKVVDVVDCPRFERAESCDVFHKFLSAMLVIHDQYYSIGSQM